MTIGTILLESGRTRWIELSDGKPWPHEQCFKCCNYVLRNDMAYCPSGLGVCLPCSREVQAEKPRPQKATDDPILKILHGRMTTKMIAAKSKLFLKQAEGHLEDLKSQGLVKYNGIQWEKTR